MKLDARDIHAVAADIHLHKRREDFERFFTLLAKAELFVPVKPRPGVEPPTKMPDGRMWTNDEMFLFPVAAFPDGTKFSLFFLREDDPRIEQPAIAVSAHDAFRVVLLRKHVDGLVIQCEGDDKLAIPKPMVQEILNKFLAE